MFIALIVILLLLPLVARQRFERLTPPFAFGVMAALLPFAMAGRLSAFVWLAAAVAAALAALTVWQCVRDPARLRQWAGLLLTPGFACFVLLAVVLYYSSAPRLVWWGDDLRYWALQPKSLYLSDGLLNGQWTLLPDFDSYTPGMPLLGWLGVTLRGEWNEGMLFYVQALFCVMVTLPIFQRLSWKRFYWTPLAMAYLLLFPMAFNGFTPYALCVDTPLGLCFGYALCQLWRMREDPSRFRLTCLTLSLCALVLLKQAGALLVLLSVPFLWAAGLTGKRKAVRWLIPYGAPLALCAGWAAYCGLNGLSGAHTSSLLQQVGDMLRGAWQPPEGFALLPGALWQGLLNDLRGFAYMEWHAPVEIPCLWMMLLFCLLPFLLIPLARQRKNDMKRLLLWTALAFALELAVLYLGFLTSFYSEVGEYVSDGRAMLPPLIQRYFCPVFLALGMLATMLLLDAATGRGKRLCLAAGAAVLLAVFSNWPAAIQLMVPQVYTSREADYFADYLAEQNYWTDDLETPESSIVLYGIGEKQTEPWKWQYALAPVKLVYVQEFDDFAALLKEKNITHVVCLDDVNPVYEAAVEYAADGWVDTYAAYAVSWEEGEPVLTY